MPYRFGWNNFGSFMRSPFALSVLTLMMLAALESTGLGQLRTGSGSRALYRDRVAYDQHHTDGNPVVTAGYSTDGATPETASRKKTTSNSDQTVALASCQSCESGRVDRLAVSSGDVLDAGFDQSTLDGSMSSTEPSIACDDGTSIYGDEICGSDMCGDDMCGDNMCGGGMCGPGPLQRLLWRLQVRAEVPIFWRKGHNTPPLVTTAPTGTDAATAGQLGQSTTQILQGGVFGQEAQAGFRITLGTYFDPCQNYGVLFRYWNAGDLTESRTFDSDDFPILARPFLNTSTTTAAADTQLIAFPGDSTGSVTVSGRSEVYGLDVSLKRLLYSDRFTRLDWLSGYQHTSIREQLLISSQTTVTGNVPPLQGSSVSVLDQFNTRNTFDGSMLGLMSTRHIACFKLESMVRLGLGNLRREVQVSGRTTTTSSGATSTDPEGLLARGTNSRSLVNDTFVIAPEVGINLAYAITPLIDFTVGYNYAMVPKVYQASRLIDPTLQVNLSDPLTGDLDPALQLVENNYWVRTLGLGLQIRY